VKAKACTEGVLACKLVPGVQQVAGYIEMPWEILLLTSEKRSGIRAAQAR
jgi:hypothetical protein